MTKCTQPGLTRQKKWTISAGAVISFFLLVSCSQPEGNDNDLNAESSVDPAEHQSNYSVLNTIQYSILKHYAAKAKTQGANITYPICVASDELKFTSAQRAAFIQTEEQAINKWNKALIGQTGWAVSSIKLYPVGGFTKSSCPKTDNGYPVYRVIGIAGNRGGASFWDYLQTVEKNNFFTPNLRREMHEYGHQLAMGDTYTEVGYEQPIGQPASIMNLYYNVDGLTQDDIDGVRQIWYMLRTGSTNPCATGYVPGKALENRNGHRFCVKGSGPNPVDNCPKDPNKTEPGNCGCGVPEGTCGTCTNKNTNCASWAAAGECTKNPSYMLTSCCKNTNCASWAAAGECTKNPGYMLTNCCASCKK
ncbi:MAG: hypothetical protein MUC50_13895 [Myxococcota bacterium]|nr:hypothetical protein [Myxococcota bacterium]